MYFSKMALEKRLDYFITGNFFAGFGKLIFCQLNCLVWFALVYVYLLVSHGKISCSVTPILSLVVCFMVSHMEKNSWFLILVANPESS